MTQPFQLAKGTVTSPIVCQAPYPAVPPAGTALSLPLMRVSTVPL